MRFLTQRRKREGGQALAEFAIAFPLQLFLVFGILQLVFLYVSSLVVNYTAYRCARAALVGEDREVIEGVTLPDGRLFTGVDLVAQTLLSPLAGHAIDDGTQTPPPVRIPGGRWGELPLSGLAGVKARVRILEEVSDPVLSDTPDMVTAEVEFNQELYFPVVDSLFRLLSRGAAAEEPEPGVTGDRYVFGPEDTDFQGLHDPVGPDLMAKAGTVRTIGGRTHFVIVRRCTLYRGTEVFDD